MTPLPQNPIVVVLVDGSNGGAPLRVATNVSADTKVVVTDNPHEFKELAEGKPFEQSIEVGYGTPPATSTLPTVPVS